MVQMTTEQAARILDPETSREALAPYAHDCQLRLAVTEEACAVAAKVLRQTEWISVKDRLPPGMEDVLVVAFWRERWQTVIGWCRKAGEEWRVYTSHGEVRPGGVTHWLPLPEPLKEE